MMKLVVKTELGEKDWNNSLPTPLRPDETYDVAPKSFQPEDDKYVAIVNIDPETHHNSQDMPVHIFSKGHFVPYNPAAERVLPAMRKRKPSLTLSKLIEQKFM